MSLNRAGWRKCLQPSPRVYVVTQQPVASDSPDHLCHRGTSSDNSANLAFNAKLQWWIPLSQLRVLDLGCSGGGFVKSILDQGGLAVGLEGSDYSKWTKRAEWASIPDHLFTADITEPFHLHEGDGTGAEKPLLFTVITSWEVMEHLRAEKLPGVVRNIAAHMAPQGIVIMSISPNEEIVDGVRLHQTVESKGWWVAKFSELGFEHHEAVLRYFGDDWVRGGENAPGSFHLVMTRRGDLLPYARKLSWLIPVARCCDVPRRVGAMVVRKSRKILQKLSPARLKRSCEKRQQAFAEWRMRGQTS